MTVTEMRERDKPISERFRIAGLEWADAKAAATILENTKSAELSKRINEHIHRHGPMAFNKAEAAVKGSDEWMSHLQRIAEAEHHSNRSWVMLKSIEMRFREMQDFNANSRAEQRITR